MPASMQDSTHARSTLGDATAHIQASPRPPPGRPPEAKPRHVHRQGALRRPGLALVGGSSCGGIGLTQLAELCQDDTTARHVH